MTAPFEHWSIHLLPYVSTQDIARYDALSPVDREEWGGDVATGAYGRAVRSPSVGLFWRDSEDASYLLWVAACLARHSDALRHAALDAISMVIESLPPALIAGLGQPFADAMQEIAYWLEGDSTTAKVSAAVLKVYRPAYGARMHAREALVALSLGLKCAFADLPKYAVDCVLHVVDTADHRDQAALLASLCAVVREQIPVDLLVGALESSSLAGGLEMAS